MIQGAEEDQVAGTIAHETSIPTNTKASTRAMESRLATAVNIKTMGSVMATILEISNAANMASTLNMVKTTETTGIMNMASPIISVLVPLSSVCMSVAIKIGSCPANGLL